MRKKLLAVLLCMCMVLTLLPSAALAQGSDVYSPESETPAPDVTYASVQTEPIVVSESKTIKLSGVNIAVGSGAENTSAIKICNSSNVNLVLEGETSFQATWL